MSNSCNDFYKYRIYNHFLNCMECIIVIKLILILITEYNSHSE